MAHVTTRPRNDASRSTLQCLRSRVGPPQGLHEACASESVETVKECREPAWRTFAQRLSAAADVPGEGAREAASVPSPRRLVCRACRHFIERVRPASAAALTAHPDFCESCQPGRHVPTTCIEHAYGTVERLSFQIKVF